MATYRVNSEELRSTASKLAAGSSQVNDQLAQLRTIVSSLGDTWQGTAQQRFDANYSEFNNGAKLVADALEKIGQELHAVAGNYDQAEQANTM